MSLSTLWDSFCAWVQWIGLPVVAIYHLLCSSIFLNVAPADARGMERLANNCLIPVHYVLAGQEAIPNYTEEGECVGYHLVQRFDYTDSLLWYKTAAAYLAIAPSLIIGGTLKGVAYLFSDVRQKHHLIASSTLISSNQDYYASIGIPRASPQTAEKLVCEGYPRRTQDESRLSAEKQALQEIVQLLEKNEIVYWLDCGTCLGAYRHGGIIPWDWDIDMAVLKPDFDNVRRVLSQLDPKKYLVQDWSSRDKPKTFLKVYVRETHALIDIYHFDLHPETQEMTSITSNENSVFLPASWKLREKRYTIPTPFSLVFPLKRASFDGVEAFVPYATKEYLEQRYGDISPVRVYDATTNQYEKVKGHPYWEESYTR